MEKRFEVRKREILEDAEIKPWVFGRALERLRAFTGPFLESLRIAQRKEHLLAYIGGLLSDLERKNTESIAYRIDADRGPLQHFIGASNWDHRPLLVELARQVNKQIGQSDGVIGFDPSGHPKCGTESVGVARQWLGRLGKVDNGQVGVYMSYAGQEAALVNERLYLSREWIKDRKRRKKCGVPREVTYKTRHQLALEMLEEQGELLRHQWITGDDEMGRTTAFRAALRERNEQYFLAVPSNTTIRDLEGEVPVNRGGRGAPKKRPFEQVRSWVCAQPDHSWKRVTVRDGEKGPLKVDILKRRVVARTEKRRVGPEELMVAVRYKDNGQLKHDYYLSNAVADTPLKELGRVVKAGHRIEECFKRAKSEAGLSHYETRTWKGWHHHQTLSLLAVWFLVLETLRGKKMDPRPYRSRGSRGNRSAVA